MTAVATKNFPPALNVTVDDDRIGFAGSLNATTVAQARREWQAAAKKGKRPIDVAELTEIDTSGALLLCALQEQGQTLVGLRTDHARLLELIAGLDRAPAKKAPSRRAVRVFVTGVGRAGAETLQDFVDFIEFTGRTAASMGQLLLHPGGIRVSAIAHHITETGVKALPIVGLLAVMISVVLAYQGVAQLRPYGGQDLTVTLRSRDKAGYRVRLGPNVSPI